uniref:Uncharacterized protein n=1 Tax=Elaeophora elaphi TaxID=1147741 RepID=A0A0R3RNS8_9BILA
MEMKMNGDCARELLLLMLLVFFAMILSSSLESKKNLLGRDSPPFIPESEEASEEYCGIFKQEELSRDELDSAFRKYVSKHGVLVNITYYRKLTELLLKAILFYTLFPRENKVKRQFLRALCLSASDGTKEIFLKILGIMLDENTAVE